MLDAKKFLLTACNSLLPVLAQGITQAIADGAFRAEYLAGFAKSAANAPAVVPRQAYRRISGRCLVAMHQCLDESSRHFLKMFLPKNRAISTTIERQS
jgi:hypothetical protein